MFGKKKRRIRELEHLLGVEKQDREYWQTIYESKSRGKAEVEQRLYEMTEAKSEAERDRDKCHDKLVKANHGVDARDEYYGELCVRIREMLRPAEASWTEADAPEPWEGRDAV